MSVRVVVADDHVVVREGLGAILMSEPGIEVAARCCSGEEAVAAAAKLRPDLVLMDLRMPGMGGVRATKQITSARLSRVLVLTTYDAQPDILAAVEAGAIGYLLKDTPRRQLVDGVRAAARGESVVAPSVAATLMRKVRTGALPALTPREAEVLRHVATGMSNPEIGRALHISETTVKTHLVHVFEKLGVHDRTAAVTAAMANGILPPPSE
ncbi:DNA-binding NarL/FixJ family response regulator [Allocatelliglobosispora scoriae]|uniref:DNA-binding NarL/FixJ family response regulator n=1 Tax=Allocatelliglobosispora scoriae TaxID=643052 RepID=A0A841C3R3_9ACTN|nr:DNA-binding NarL/FixJ family response regulator [Allocatelliglobosispora scoriae]